MFFEMPKKFTAPSSKLLRPPKISLRAQKLRRLGVEDPTAITPLPGLNKPETLIYHALKDLKIRFEIQSNVLGGSLLGGARADFLLPDYRIDLEYAGPLHATVEGASRDILRNLGLQQQGYRVVTLRQNDLRRLKPRILEVIGRPI